jgi:hypothetical protein
MKRFSDQDLGEPRVLALLFCDQVIVDRDTGKHSLIGLFEIINLRKFPTAAQPFFIYACVAGGRASETKYYLRMEAPDGEILVQASVDVDEWGPTGIWQFEVRLPGVLLSSPGEYLVRLYVEGRVLSERKLFVHKLPAPPEEQDDSPKP